jgi:hypothetical protein
MTDEREALERYQAALDKGLGDHEAREEGWPTAPTDDERTEWTASLESLIADVYTILKPIAENGSHGPNSPILKAYGLLNAQDLRRSEVPEPSADDGHDGWCGCEKCDPEPQGEPSDAQVRAAAESIARDDGQRIDVVPEWADAYMPIARAALRAAGGVR